MSSSRTVALVGRPNVGKSRLFNRLARQRLAIVHDQPGVTRDVQAVDVAEGAFTLLDTGGLGLPEGYAPAVIVAAAEEQVDFALQTATVICFVVDAREGLTPLDETIAARLRRTGRPILLVVNKVDRDAEPADLAPFRRLGFKQILGVSAEHGFGEDALRSAIAEVLGPPPAGTTVAEAAAEAAARRVAVAIVGRPNVGKSSLANRLLNAERLVVSEVAGTTRDAVALDLDYTAPDGTVWPFRLVDTAGLRKTGKIDSPVEIFSAMRTRHAIAQADVALLLLDAKEGATAFDKAIAGEVLEAGRGLVIVVNKWDLALDSFRSEEGVEGYKTEREFRKAFTAALRRQLFFVPNCPVLFVSAKTGYAIPELLAQVRGLDESLGRKLPTGQLNAALHRMIERKAPKLVQGKRFKLYYAVQTSVRPYTFRLFCNRETALDEQYRRYLEKGMIEEFELAGTPLRFELRGKETRYGGGTVQTGRPD